MGITYKDKVTPAEAVRKAVAKAKSSLADAIDKGKVLNCGDDDDYVYTDEMAALSTAWERQSFEHDGVTYKAKKIAPSSGEPKFDLRFAADGGKSVFNYHVPFKADTRAADEAARKSAEDKKHAAAEKKRMEEEDARKKAEAAAKAEEAKAAAALAKKREQAMATEYKKLAKPPADKAKWVKEWLEKNKNRKF